MKTLTTCQKQFLLDYFFKNEKYAGWRNIATALLETGTCIVPACIVPGDRCIWNGGIGNFIKTSDAPNAIDCLLYTFDLEYFLSFKWYKEINEAYVLELANKIEDLLKEHYEIKNLNLI
jgi:hypothetical protein